MYVLGSPQAFCFLLGFLGFCEVDVLPTAVLFATVPVLLLLIALFLLDPGLAIPAPVPAPLPSIVPLALLLLLLWLSFVLVLLFTLMSTLLLALLLLLLVLEVF